MDTKKLESTVYEMVLFRFKIPVDNPQTVQMVQGQGQLCKVKLDILFCKHYLE